MPGTFLDARDMLVTETDKVLAFTSFHSIPMGADGHEQYTSHKFHNMLEGGRCYAW